MISPRVENRASVPATDVTLTLTPNTGITVDSATWGPGNCTISSNVVTCQAATLAAQANDELLVQGPGVSEGGQSYTMAISSSETDRDTSNNNVSGQINVGQVTTAVVNTQQSSSGSGGGGATSLAFLLLLAAGRLLSCRRMTHETRRSIQAGAVND